MQSEAPNLPQIWNSLSPQGKLSQAANGRIVELSKIVLQRRLNLTYPKFPLLTSWQSEISIIIYDQEYGFLDYCSWSWLVSEHPWETGEKSVSVTRAHRLRDRKNTEFVCGSWEKRSFVKVAVRTAVRLRERPIGEVSISCSHAINILSLFCLRGDLHFLFWLTRHDFLLTLWHGSMC